MIHNETSQNEILSCQYHLTYLQDHPIIPMSSAHSSAYNLRRTQMKTRTSRINNSLGNERGAMAILSVVILSFVVVTTLTTVYIYLVNRAKYHSRIREAYQLTHVMEQFGKLTRQAYDTANSISGTLCPGSTPGNPVDRTNTIPVTGVAMCFPPCSSAQTPTAIAACKANIGNMCINHLGKDYCLESTPVVGDTGTVSLDSKKTIVKVMISAPAAMTASNQVLSNWYARLDKFFDSSVSVPMERTARNQFLPALNTKIPVPSAFKWIERETYALAGDDEASQAISDSGDGKTEVVGSKGENTEPVPSETEGLVMSIDKGDTCANASPSLPTCSNSSPGRTSPESLDLTRGQTEILPTQQEPPKICQVEPKSGQDGQPVIVQCLEYCQAQPSLPGCRGVTSVTTNQPNCEKSPTNALCQKCEAGQCFELGYCLSGMDCNAVTKPGNPVVRDESKFFKQSVRLIL